MKYINCYLFICILFGSCNESYNYSKNVEHFRDTEAYKLAIAVEDEDLEEIENQIKSNPLLLEEISSSGSNVLLLSIYIDRHSSFKKLLDLGADTNFINPISKTTPLLAACTPFGNSMEWKINNNYAEHLLKNGANPNYYITNSFVNAGGVKIRATSPLIKAAKMNLDLVKLLIDYDADYNIRVEGKSPLASAVESAQFDIIHYFIEELEVDVTLPMTTTVRKPMNENVTFYIQDYIMKKSMSYEPGSEGDIKKQRLIDLLESKGIDFEDYDYKY